MLTGRRFPLLIETLAVEDTEAAPGRVMGFLQAGDVVKVVSEPHEVDRRIDVIWKQRLVAMFAIDIEERGEEITAKSA